MTRIAIKSERPAERCEICHQADCFDASANYCARCHPANIEEIQLSNAGGKKDAGIKYLVFGTAGGALAGITCFTIMHITMEAQVKDLPWHQLATYQCQQFDKIALLSFAWLIIGLITGGICQLLANISADKENIDSK
jgi:hypothetical protein